MLHLTPNLRSSVLVALALAIVTWMAGCQQEPTPTPTMDSVRPTPTETALPVPTETPSSTPTATPTLTSSTPAATPTPTPTKEQLAGTLPNHPCGPSSFRSNVEFSEYFIHWTPDGAQLVFEFNETIWMADSDGTTLQSVVDANPREDDYYSHRYRGYIESMYGFHADVSPDGSRIVYSTCEYQHVRRLFRKSPIASYGYEIGAIGLDGTAPRRLTDNTRFESYPVWSPDGTRIAFVMSYDGDYYQDKAQLYIMSEDGSNMSRATWEVLKRVAPFPPVWSPDVQYLAFIILEGEYSPQAKRILHVVQVDGSETTRIAETTSVPSWSPDSRELAFANVNVDGDNPTIYTVRPDGAGLRTVWSSGSDTPLPPISQVSWSPDGSELLFVAQGVYIVAADGSGLRTLTEPRPMSMCPDYAWPALAAWSPDGSRVAVYYPEGPEPFDEYGHPGSELLLTIAPDGTDPHILVVGNDEGNLHLWNPSRNLEVDRLC